MPGTRPRPTDTTAQPNAPTPEVPRQARWATITYFFAAGAGLGSWFPRIPEVQRSLGLSYAELGFALLGPAVGSLLAMPATGWLVARWGSRRVTTAAALAFGTALLPPTLAPALPLLFLALVVLGAANGALNVAINVQAVAVEERYRRPIMSSFHGVFSVGSLAGGAGAWLAIARGLGPTPHLLAVGLTVIALAGIAAGRLLPIAAAGRGTPTFARPSRALAGLGAVAFCVMVAEGAMADWSAVYLRDLVESHPGTTIDILPAAGFAAFSATMVVGRFSGDRLVARFGPSAIVRAGGAVIALGLGCGLLIGGPWAALVGFALVGLGLACAAPLIVSAAGRTPGMATGAAVAAIATVAYTGYLAGPALIGFAAQVVGLRSALAIVVLLGAVMVALARVVGRASDASDRPQHQPTPASTVDEFTTNGAPSTGHPLDRPAQTPPRPNREPGRPAEPPRSYPADQHPSSLRGRRTSAANEPRRQEPVRLNPDPSTLPSTPCRSGT